MRKAHKRKLMTPEQRVQEAEYKRMRRKSRTEEEKEKQRAKDRERKYYRKYGTPYELQSSLCSSNTMIITDSDAITMDRSPKSSDVTMPDNNSKQYILFIVFYFLVYHISQKCYRKCQRSQQSVIHFWRFDLNYIFIRLLLIN